MTVARQLLFRQLSISAREIVVIIDSQDTNANGIFLRNLSISGDELTALFVCRGWHAATCAAIALLATRSAARRDHRAAPPVRCAIHRGDHVRPAAAARRPSRAVPAGLASMQQ